MENKLVIFVHIPKTAGTTLLRLSKQNYRKKEQQVILMGEDLNKALETVNKNAALKFVQGHYPFGLHESVNKKATYLTMLRDPIERVISEYYFIRKDAQHDPFIHQQIKDHNMGIRDYVENANKKFRFRTENMQTHFLSGGHADSIQKAKKNIESHFAVVGITEMFDQSLMLIKNKLGWKNIQYEKLNVNKQRPLKNEINEEVIRKIKAKNKLDIELYNWVKSRLKQQISSLR